MEPSLTQDPCWEAGWKVLSQPSETSAARFEFGVSTKMVGTIKAGAQRLLMAHGNDSHT